MNNLTSAEVQLIAQTEIALGLEQLGFENGELLSDQQIKDTTKVLYWLKLCNRVIGQNKPILITFSVFDSQVSSRADNVIRSREAAVSINIFSTLSATNKKYLQILQQIENKFCCNWEITLENVGNETNHANFTLYKNFIRS